MSAVDDFPEEDRFLRSRNTTTVCRHTWCDLYYGTGVDRKDVNVQWTYFFCKHCLKTRLVRFDQSMMRLNEDMEQEREEKGI